MPIQKVKFNQHSREALEQIIKGAFLTAKDGDRVNTMTIGWGNIGIVWGKPIFMVAVRYSRYTYDLIESSKEFTVSIPINKDLKKELAYCGRYSGKDVDKFKECNITIVDGQKVSAPIIGECDLHYECKVVYQQAMEPVALSKDIKEKYYTKNDYHVLYFGEIVDSYLKE
ncbi:MAG: flavin reductase family protein [Tissierellales bacterium]